MSRTSPSRPRTCSLQCAALICIASYNSFSFVTSSPLTDRIHSPGSNPILSPGESGNTPAITTPVDFGATINAPLRSRSDTTIENATRPTTPIKIATTPKIGNQIELTPSATTTVPIAITPRPIFGKMILGYDERITWENPIISGTGIKANAELT